MGYKGERASLNQYTPLKQYLIDSGAVNQLKRVYGLTEKFRESIKNDKTEPGELVPTKLGAKPFEVMAFDAGLARFFKDSPYEVVALKIAGGASPAVTEKYSSILSPVYTHVFTGLAKNPRIFKAITKREDRVSASTLAATEVSRLFNSGVLKDFNELMNTTFGGDFRTEIETWIQKTTKTPELDNLAREFAEWFFILRAAIETDGKDVLIVKDGSLITNQFGSGEGLALRLQSLFRGEIQGLSPLLIGVVKESRFVKDEGHVVGRAIWKYARSTKGNVFFKIPHGLESLLDATTEEAKTVDRLFLSIGSGVNVYEIQFPKAITADENTFNRARMTVLSQITSMYGGSIASNSIAHRAASLSEVEAQALERHIRNLVEVKDEDSR
jgi:hypothetical protein